MKLVINIALALVAGLPLATVQGAEAVVKPRVVTEAVKHDSDDPAIWINRAQAPAERLPGSPAATIGNVGEILDLLGV